MEERFPIAERFISINGEGLESGRLAAFIRFAGCNLNCSYCDTRWANAREASWEDLSCEEIVAWVQASGVSAVTLTGGEPLLQKDLPHVVLELLRVSMPHPLRVEIETNGSLPIDPLVGIRDILADEGFSDRLHLTLDWKTPSAGTDAADAMLCRNYQLLNGNDAVKFVIGTPQDVAFAKRQADEAGLWDRCTVLLSPLWGQMNPDDLVSAMKAEHLHEARLQLQLHKVIWPEAAKGV